MLLRSVAKGRPATLAVGPHQYGYLFQGGGTRPSRIDLGMPGAVGVVDMGMDAPVVPADVEMGGDPRYYIARFDVIEGGVGYNKAPTVTLSGGEPEKEATARAFLSGVSVGDIDAVKNGRGYKSTPTVSIDGGIAGSAVLTATLVDDLTPQPTTRASAGAMSSFTVISEPSSGVCLPAGAVGSNNYFDFITNGPGNNYSVEDAYGNRWSVMPGDYHGNGEPIRYQVNGAQRPDTPSAPLTEFSVIITFSTVTRALASGTYNFPARFLSLSWLDRGTGYTSPVVLERPKFKVPAAGGPDPSALDCGGAGSSGGFSMRLTPEPGGGTVTPPVGVTGTPRAIKSVTVTDGGSGFTTPPVIAADDEYGSGAELKAVLVDGKITEVKVVKGGLYTQAPSLKTNTSGAQAVAITRAHIRGKYDCYYRYLDDTPTNRGGPIPTNLSPVKTIDAGDGVGLLVWTIPLPDGARPKTVELWRTASDEAYTVYRVASMPAVAPPKTTIAPPPDGMLQFRDDFTDLELQDFDRPGYAAMPVLLPNGELNANRFGVPPFDKAVAVMFQDRLWMALDTSGLGPNTLRFSEYNEPESCPDINELALQTNVKGQDYITALIPYGASLGVMQSRHSYRLSYVSQPLLDANLQISSYRGCLNQRCWDEFEGLIYCMDAEGVYAMDQGGQVQPLSLGLRDVFENKIDFSKSEWFSVTTDRKARCLRVAVRYREDARPGPTHYSSPAGKYPTRVLCYSFDAQGWWEERYPHPLVGAAAIRDASGLVRCVYGGADGGLYEVNSGDSDYAFGSVQSVTLTNPGSNYVLPPRVTIKGDGTGAVAEASVGPDGKVLGVYLRFGGWGYTTASIEIDGGGGSGAAASCEVGDGNPAIPCWFKSGNMEYPHDSLPVEMPDKNRNVGLLFTPTAGSCLLKLRMYYNNSPHARVNVAARDRGTGVVYETLEPCVSLDMDANLLPGRISSGVCRALFSSHTVDDIQGNDRHVAIELSAAVGGEGPVEIHAVDVFGTPGG